VLGNSAASPKSNTPKTWVAIVDVLAGVLVLLVVVRFLRRPRDPKRVAGMIDQVSKVTSSPVIAIAAAVWTHREIEHGETTMSETEFDVLIAAYLIPDLAQEDFDGLAKLVADKSARGGGRGARRRGR
jgi:hypothetical protein